MDQLLSLIAYSYHLRLQASRDEAFVEYLLLNAAPEIISNIMNQIQEIRSSVRSIPKRELMEGTNFSCD